MTLLRRVLGRFCSVLVLAVAVLGVFPEQASAQFGMFGAMDSGQNMVPVSRRGIEQYGKLLGFNEDQKGGLKALYEGYREIHQNAMKDMQSGMEKASEEMQDGGDWSTVIKETTKIAKDGMDKMQSAKRSFMGDVKALCDETQASKWEKLERLQRRSEYLRYGMVSGGGLDVIDAADRAGATTAMTPELGEALDRYETDMDRQLMAMENFVDDTMKGLEDMASGDMQKMMEKQQEMMKKVSDIGFAVRDLNAEHSRKVAELVSEDVRPKFQAEVLRRTYPRVYKEAHVIKQMGAAEKLSGVGADQKEQIAQLRESYNRDAVPLNQKWADAIREREEQNKENPMAQFMNWDGGGTNPVKDAKKARGELDEKAAERLKAIVGDTAFDSLPEEKKQASWREDMDFDFGEEEEGEAE